MWRKHFSTDALKEGYEYYKNGSVDDFHCLNWQITARVIDYNVFIDFKDNDINSMYCHCRVRGCSHQSAVLFHLDNLPSREYLNLISSFSHDDFVDF